MSPSSLCQQCALCCDGTLFARVVLQPDEPRAPAELCAVPGARGTSVVPQRCAALSGSRCAVYAARPRACRTFDCLLVAALQAEEVALEEALEVVAEARRRVAEVGEQLHVEDDAMGTSRRLALGEDAPGRSAALRAENYLRFHFTGHLRR